MNTTTQTADKNLSILNERIAQYDKREGARVGDYLLLHYGLVTRFTHKWDDSIQTGGTSSSYYLGNGYISYSGGLDSGVKLSDIELTEETKMGNIWFFDKDISGAGRGVHYQMPFRVFKLKDGADLSGLPQIKEYEKKAIQAQAETITRINGNGQPYTLPLPELYINIENLNDVALSHIEKQTGLNFVKWSFGYVAQPMKHDQISKLLLTYNFETTYYNNASNHNILFLKFNRK